MPEIPEKLGKYYVLGIAGRGNMGVVYTGYDPFIDIDVAIKVCLRPDGLSESQLRVAEKLFFNEAHMAGLLDHPNILRILDAGEDDGEQYIVMEYVEGAQTLKSYCTPDSLLPIPKVAEYIATCARALGYAHNRGVIHRDIKPTNIMLTEAGEVKIGDFGIAQRIRAETTHILGALGTPRYMSPEQLEEELITGQTDLYSLGVMMFELLTGRMPFTAISLNRLIHDIINTEPPSILELRPDLPESLDAIVSCALEKDPADRYRNSSDMASDLAAVFSEIAHPDDGMDDQDKFVALRNLPFFKDFTDSEIWETFRVGVWQSYTQNQTILSENHQDSSFNILVAGQANVIRDGKQISTLSGGDCFGELGYDSLFHRSASIASGDDLSLLRITEAQMEHVSATCQLRFHKAFTHSLIERLASISGPLPNLGGND